MSIDLNVVLVIFAGVVAFAVSAAFLFVIPVLISLKKNLDSSNEIIQTVEEGLKPSVRNITEAISAVSRTTGTVAKKVEEASRFLKVLSLVDTAVDFVKDISDKAAKPGRKKVMGLLAGLKKGYEILTKARKL